MQEVEKAKMQIIRSEISKEVRVLNHRLKSEDIKNKDNRNNILEINLRSKKEEEQVI